MTCANCGAKINSSNDQYCARCKANSILTTVRRVLGNKDVQHSIKDLGDSTGKLIDTFDVMKSNDD